MGEGAEPRRTDGDTALLITVPEADALVHRAREAFDPMYAAGVPAHVTVLYPFLPRTQVGEDVLAGLRELFAGHEPFDLVFAGFGRFPDLLWLAPEPDWPVRALIAAMEARWPQVPPYGGAFPDPAPHLTVAGGQSEETYAALEREFSAGLPLSTQVTGVHLVVNDGVRWGRWETFPLGGPGVGAEPGAGAGAGRATTGLGIAGAGAVAGGTAGGEHIGGGTAGGEHIGGGTAGGEGLGPGGVGGGERPGAGGGTPSRITGRSPPVGW